MDYKDVSARYYILDLMNKCWEKYARDRPTFTEIRTELEEHASGILDFDWEWRLWTS